MLAIRALTNRVTYFSLAVYREATEPAILWVATNQVTQILNAKYKKENLPKVVRDNYRHLNAQQRNELLQLLIHHEESFNSTLGDWQDELVSFELKKDAKPYHGRPFTMP